MDYREHAQELHDLLSLAEARIKELEGMVCYNGNHDHKGSEHDRKVRAEVWREAAKLVDGYEHANHGFNDPLSDCDYCRELDEIQKGFEAKAQAEGGA